MKNDRQTTTFIVGRKDSLNILALTNHSDGLFDLAIILEEGGRVDLRKLTSTELLDVLQFIRINVEKYTTLPDDVVTDFDYKEFSNSHSLFSIRTSRDGDYTLSFRGDNDVTSIDFSTFNSKAENAKSDALTFYGSLLSVIHDIKSYVGRLSA